MKKRVFLIGLILFIALFAFEFPIYATSPAVNSGNGYKFDIIYEGEIYANEAKRATVVLQGTEATPYSKVRVESKQVSGPSKDIKLMAYDEQGREFDISESGNWGPESGFQVGGTFRNETPIVITYPQAGTYVSEISLIDLEHDNAVIVSQQFTQIVKEKPVVSNNIVNNTIEEIPQAGISFWVYVLTIAIVIVVLILAKKFLIKK